MEHRRRCTACGNVYCYTDSDIKDSNLNSINSTVSALGALSSLMGGGTLLNAQAFNAQSERYRDKVIDFTRCPHCHSQNTVELSEEEWLKIQRQPEWISGKRIEINPNATPQMLLKRAELFLEDSDWLSANAYCNAVLDVEPENAIAYLGKLMAELQVQKKDQLSRCSVPFDTNANYKKCIRFAESTLANEIEGYCQQIKERNENTRIESIYQQGISAMNSAIDIWDYQTAINKFEQVPDYRDANDRIVACLEQIKARREVEARRARERESAIKKKKKAFVLIAIGLLSIVIISCVAFFSNINSKIELVSSQLDGISLSFSCVEESEYFSHHRSGEITFYADGQCKEFISVYYTRSDYDDSPHDLPTKENPAEGTYEGSYTIAFSGENTIIQDLAGYRYILVYDTTGAPISLIDDPSS